MAVRKFAGARRTTRCHTGLSASVEATCYSARMKLASVIRIENLDEPIYRVFRLWQFEELVRMRHFWLTPPRAWDDPYEDFAAWCAITEQPPAGPYTQVFLQNGHLAPAYAQCWSKTGDSDTLRRAYSQVVIDPNITRNLYPGSEGVLVRSTPRKLFAALQRSLPETAPIQSAYVGNVEYVSREEVHQRFANAIHGYGLDAFKHPELRAQSLLVKRPAFAHEDEVRLIYVELRPIDNFPPRIQVRLPDVNNLIDEVWFDPRLQGLDLSDRADMARREYGTSGYKGPISTWETYQRTFLEIGVPSFAELGKRWQSPATGSKTPDTGELGPDEASNPLETLPRDANAGSTIGTNERQGDGPVDEPSSDSR
jgi:hypothetical protein